MQLANMFAVLVSMSPLSLLTSLPAATSPVDACQGCTASEPQAADNAGPSGYVAIQVSITSGACAPFNGHCVGCPCDVIITRTWSGTAPNAPIGFCKIIGGLRTCESPAPTTGVDGAGSLERTDSVLCGSSTYFTISVGTGLETSCAGVTASCSGCGN